MLIALNKPYGVLSAFTPDGSPNRTLAEFGLPARVYPIGRLDADSEGLLLLTDEKDLPDRILPPHRAHARTYLVQVEGIPTKEALRRLESGVQLSGKTTIPCEVQVPEPQPEVPPRTPPIRVRKTVPDTWIIITLTEGKNRQVRRMTAAVGHPTLRLIRVAIGAFALGALAPGTWRELGAEERAQVLDSRRGSR
ncbi:MAG: pseudouridine synthase [Candidatus Kapaibacterium sp.]